MLKSLDKLDVWDKIGNMAKEDLLRKHSLTETIMSEDDAREIPVRETLIQQNQWLSEENRKLIERNINLLKEKEEKNLIIDELEKKVDSSGRDQAELEAQRNTKESEQAIVTELKVACEELQRSNGYLKDEAENWAKKCREVFAERDLLSQDKKTLTEKLNLVKKISDEVEMLELLTEEIRQLTTRKTELSATIEALGKKKGFADLHYWIRMSVRLGDYSNRKSTPEIRKKIHDLVAGMKDVTLYGDIPNLFSYIEEDRLRNN